MVTDTKETRGRPECALNRIHELAAAQSVIYGGDRVQRDSANLGYSFEAVCQCLTELKADDFHHAERYSPIDPWSDVYLMSYSAPSGDIDPLYIKLKLNRDCVVILLHSFHREGAL